VSLTDYYVSVNILNVPTLKWPNMSCYMYLGRLNRGIEEENLYL